MTQVRQLTVGQKNSLVGQEFMTGALFNPTQDADGNWFISNEEVEQCNKVEFSWVKSLPQINYKPPIYKN